MRNLWEISRAKMKLGQCLAMHLLFLGDSAQEKLGNYMIKK